MYGDNAAAIGLAHGVTAASWRTRYLRIRSSILKEALQESSDVPGGRWQLTHLKGTELVADGCTKPLNGQAFFRFLEDLGLKRGVKAEAGETTSTGDGAMIGGGGGFAAVKALVIGSTLISAAQGASNEDKGDIDFTPFMVTGAALMAFGAIYVEQLVQQASSCCLRRIKALEEGERRPANQQWEEEESSEDGSFTVIPGDEVSQGTTPMRLTKRSGSCSAARATSLGLTTQSGSSSAACTTSRSLTKQSGSSSAARATSQKLTSRLGLSAGGTSSDGVDATSTSMPQQSGSQQRGRNSLRANQCSGGVITAGDGGHSDGGSPGGECSLGEPGAAAASSSSTSGSALLRGGEDVQTEHVPENPWNRFQHENKGRGWSKATMSKKYNDLKKTGMP